MRIEIEIPKEFEEHFNQDKFKDSFERIMADIKHSLENGDCLCAGRYEYETIEMLQKAFENSKTVYDMDDVANAVIEITERISNNCNEIELDWPEEERTGYDMNEDILKIRHLVKHGCIETDDVCEWKLTDTKKLMPYKTSCGNEDLYDNSYKYCPYCGKKIKGVK